MYLGVVLVVRAWSAMQTAGTPLVSLSVTWAELVVGVALAAGCFTRFAAAVVLVLSVNRLIQAGQVAWTPAGSDALVAAIALALLLGAAGRTAGLDAVLARRWPRSPLW
jgi:uncharacterized membrane protein YphA (DoxX/SURF4 family)